MELNKKEDWEDDDMGTWEGWVGGEDVGIRLFVGPRPGYSHVDGKPNIIVDLPHQCEAWEVVYARANSPEIAIAGVEEMIKELQEVVDYMKTDRFAEIIKEVEDGCRKMGEGT